MAMSRPDGIMPRRFARRELDVVGPYKETPAPGTKMTRYDITRRHDGASAELTYWRSVRGSFNLSTIWPGNLFSIPNENLESLFLLMLEQVEDGIDRID